MDLHFIVPSAAKTEKQLLGHSC